MFTGQACTHFACLHPIQREASSIASSLFKLATAAIGLTLCCVLVGVGAKNPSEIILPTLIVTTISFVSAILMALLFKKLWMIKEGKW